MEQSSTISLPVVLFGLVFCLGACVETTPPGPNPAPVQLTPTAPVEISYIAPDRVEAGEEAEVVVSFKLRAPAEDLVLTVTEGKGLSLQSEAAVFDYGSQPAGSSFSETVSAASDGVGVRYLNVFVEGTFQGIRLGSTAAVPLRTGEGADRAALEPPGRIRTDGEGRKIIEMPVPGAGK